MHTAQDNDCSQCTLTRMDDASVCVCVCVCVTHPGILPLVWHGDDVPVEQVHPVPRGIATIVTFLWWLNLLRVTLQPGLNHVVIELLCPEEACVCVCVKEQRAILHSWKPVHKDLTIQLEPHPFL